jgi:hypothetical protein
MILKFGKREKQTLSQRHFVFRRHFRVVLLAVAPFDLEVHAHFPWRLGLQAEVVGRFRTSSHRQLVFVVTYDLREDLRLRPSIGQCHFNTLLVVLLVRGKLVLDRQLRIQRLFDDEACFLAVQDDEKGPCRVE